MTRPVTLLGLAAGAALTVAALAVVAPHLIEGDAFLGLDRDTALPWLSACFAGLGLVAALLTLVVGRVIDSARRQCRRTAHALQPLLLLPAVAAPVDVADLLHELHLDGRTRLIVLDTPVALCHGLLRPSLLLSTGALRGLSSAEVAAVLRHEQAHVQRRDPLRLVVVRALAEALPVLPMLQKIAAALPVTQELAADRAALAAVGADALGGALLKVGDALGPRQDQLLTRAFGALDARIDQLLGVSLPSLSPSPLRLLPIVAVLVLSPWPCVLLSLPWSLLWCAMLVASVLGVVGHRWRVRQARPSQYHRG